MVVEAVNAAMGFNGYAETAIKNTAFEDFCYAIFPLFVFLLCAYYLAYLAESIDFEEVEFSFSLTKYYNDYFG